jgi:hypothetical protein
MKTPTHAAPPVASTDLLAVLDDAFGLEQLEKRWKPYGYTVATAMLAKAAYEEWAKEDLHFDCLDDAICGTNETGGDFPIRLESFFAGWISSANARAMTPGANGTPMPAKEQP